MKAMMRDKDPERGINSGAEKRAVVKERLKKSGRGKMGGWGDTLILIISRSVREGPGGAQ